MKKTTLILFIFLIGCITRPLTLTTKDDDTICCLDGDGTWMPSTNEKDSAYTEVFIAEQCANNNCYGVNWYPIDSSFEIFGDTMEVIKMLWYLDMKNRKEIDSLQQKIIQQQLNCIIK